MNTSRFLIAWDNASKRYPFRVTTTSGETLAYFRAMVDAARFCEVSR